MTTTTMRTLLAAAALAVATTASAQTFKAEVPMAFQIAGKTLAAGTYTIRMQNNGTGEMVTLYDKVSHSSAVLMAGVTVDAPRAWRDAGDAKIAFEYRDGKYLLRTLWTGEGLSAHQFPVPQSHTVTARTELVTLAMVKAH